MKAKPPPGLFCGDVFLSSHQVGTHGNVVEDGVLQRTTEPFPGEHVEICPARCPDQDFCG